MSTSSYRSCSSVELRVGLSTRRSIIGSRGRARAADCRHLLQFKRYLSWAGTRRSCRRHPSRCAQQRANVVHRWGRRGRPNVRASDRRQQELWFCGTQEIAMAAEQGWAGVQGHGLGRGPLRLSRQSLQYLVWVQIAGRRERRRSPWIQPRRTFDTPPRQRAVSPGSPHLVPALATWGNLYPNA